MRGAILNFLQGMPLYSPVPVVELSMSAQEFSFWMWRVHSVQFQAEAQITGKIRYASGETGSGGFSYGIGGIVTPFGVATEEDQLLTRKGYTANFSTTAGTSETRLESFSFQMEFAHHGYNPLIPPIDNKWVTGFSAGLTISFNDAPDTDPDPDEEGGAGAGTMSVFPPQEPYPGSGAIILRGVDLARGGSVYQHSLPIYWDGRAFGNEPDDQPDSGLTSASGIIVVTAFSFHPWRHPDTGIALFDTTTGAYA